MLTKTKQLVDLNGDSTNFRIQFNISSKDNKPFEMAIVDQTTLDNNPNIEYIQVNEGQRSGQFEETSNVYQNYFLVLKAQQPCEVIVEINKEELPRTQIEVPPQLSAPTKEDGFNWVKILLVVGVLATIATALYWYSKKEEGNPQPRQRLFSPPQPSPVKPSPSPVTNPLLQRLKSLNL
ncbi:MAG: hypothetical protein JSS09_03445 [Verrucomicrobia bacterium]|nr:hypothetical protein [Verrucomicrobiota bacterium]